MKNVKRIMALCCALVLCLCVFTGCGAENDKKTEKIPANDLQLVKEAGKLVIGITDYNPMNFYDENGNLTGFDTEYAKAVCKILGVEAEFIEIEWANLEAEVSGYSVDCGWNGTTYTEKRDKNMDFSDSYLYNNIVLVINKKDAAKYVDTASLSAARIVAEGGSTGEAAVKENSDLKGANIISSTSLVASLTEVSAGTADAAAVDSLLANSIVGTGSYDNLMIIEGVILSQEEIAPVFRSGSSLVAEINKATETLRADGTMKALAEKYKVDLIEK